VLLVNVKRRKSATYRILVEHGLIRYDNRLFEPISPGQFNESTRTKFDGSHSDGFSSTTLARLRRSYLAMIAPLDHKPVADYRRPHRNKVS
jgi:hypothetical protein